MTIAQDYLAGTDPTNAADVLAITSFSRTPGGASANLSWKSVLTRRYYIQESLNVSGTNWFDSGLGLITPTGSITTQSLSNTNVPARFFRVEAVRPLAP